MGSMLRLDALEIHMVQRQVVLSGRPIALGARAFDVLLALAQRNDRLVSKNELLDLVWGGQIVEENNLTVQISALRKALGSDAIATVPGRGYRLALGGGASAPVQDAMPPSAPITAERLQRRLVAIVQASVVGWGKLIARQPTQAVGLWKALRSAVVEPSLREYGARPEELTPERMRIEFGSVVDAAQWALQIQQASERRAAEAAVRLHLRIAIVVDDAIVDDGKLMGMGVRELDELHALAQHDEILIAEPVRVLLAGRLDSAFVPVDAGARHGKAQAQTLWLLHGRPPSLPSEDAGIRPFGLALRQVPTLAVLPLQNLGPPGDAYLATGLTEQIIAFLSLSKALAVIAHGSTLAFERGMDDSQRAAASLGAEYVLAGSLQRHQTQLQIQMCLKHMPTQSIVLQQPFVGDLGDLLGFQEQLAGDIAGAVDPQVLDSEIHHLMRRPTSDPSAYDCLLRGLALLHDPRRGIGSDEAGDHLRRAIALDEGYAQAHAQLAWWHNLRVGESRSAQVDVDRRAALAHALRGVELDPRDATVLAVAGHVQSFLAKQFTQAMALFDQALLINPSCALAWARSATTLAYIGQGEQSLARVQQAMRLSPNDPNRFAFLTTRGTAALVLGRYDEACAWLAQARRLNPGYRAALRLLIAALVLGDDMAQAMALAEEFMASEPEFSVAEFGRWYPLQEPYLSQVLQALRRAGLPH